MDKINFNDLPEAIAKLLARTERIEELLSKQSSTTKNSPNKPLTIKEAAAFLNLAPQTLYGLTCKKTIPHYKKNKRLYFKQEELELWLKDGRKQELSVLVKQKLQQL
ncbi:helix-turn-helix domain-containing protein [Candidatus Woesearchaeota archaeon]|nr:helix-turn-helix domain-containing protein [Candidatus Woesearchaeota archaeon]